MLPSIAATAWSLLLVTFFLRDAHPYAANAYVANIVKTIEGRKLQGFCSNFIQSTAQANVVKTIAGKSYTRYATTTSTRTVTKTANARGTTASVITSSVFGSTVTTVTQATTSTQTLAGSTSTILATTSVPTTMTTTSTAYSTITVTATPNTVTARTTFTTYTTQGVPIGYNKRSAIVHGDMTLDPEDVSPLETPALHRRANEHVHHAHLARAPHEKHRHNEKRKPEKPKKKKHERAATTTKSNNKLVGSPLPAALAKFNRASVSAACTTVFAAKTVQTKAAGFTTTLTRTAYATVTTTSTMTIYASSRSTTVVTGGTSTFTSTVYSPVFTSTVSPQTMTLSSTTTVFIGSIVTATGTGTTTLTSWATTPTTYSTSVVSSALPSPTYVNYQSLNDGFQNQLDQIPDYSWAGYHSSTVSLPSKNQAATYTLSSTNDQTDRTADIQNALNNCNGLGGVIELGPGTYYVNSGTISITQSNCIFRGRLNGGDPQTIIVMTGAYRSAFTVGSPKQLSPVWQNEVNITDPYVPVGTNVINVTDASQFSVGQTVAVQRTASQQWINYMGMNTLVRNGANQTWIPVGAVLNQFRTITNINQNTVTVDIPLTDAVDNVNMYDNGTITSYTPPASYKEIGIENLFIVAIPDETGMDIVTGNGAGLTFGSWVSDSWSRNVIFEGFNGPTSVGRYSFRITLANNQFRRDLTTNTAAGQAADVLVNGQQVLVTGAITRNNPGSYTFGVTTGSAVSGPNVAFNCFSIGYDVTAPHQRWATGFLIDASVTAQSIFGNRGTAGSGQGWVMGAGMNWNVIGYRGFSIMAPPISMNFCVGCVGTNVGGTGVIVSPNAPVLPASLFVAQLQNRIGNSAASAAVTY